MYFYLLSCFVYFLLYLILFPFILFPFFLSFFLCLILLVPMMMNHMIHHRAQLAVADRFQNHVMPFFNKNLCFQASCQ